MPGRLTGWQGCRGLPPWPPALLASHRREQTTSPQCAAGWQGGWFTSSTGEARPGSGAGHQLRFIMRWPTRYRLADPAWQITRGKRSQDHRQIWDLHRRQYRKTGIVAVPVRHPQGEDPWMVVQARGANPGTLTNEPIATDAWRVVMASRRWQVEMCYRACKTDLAMESPRLWFKTGSRLLSLRSCSLCWTKASNCSGTGATERESGTAKPRYRIARRTERPMADPSPSIHDRLRDDSCPDELSLTETICLRDTRKVARDNTVKYQWRVLQLLPGAERPSYAGLRVEVLERADGELMIRYQGEAVDFQEGPPPSSALWGAGSGCSSSPELEEVTDRVVHSHLNVAQRERLSTLESAAKEMVGQGAIGRTLRHQLHRKPTATQQARWEAVQLARQQGLSLRAIARNLGMSRVAARKYAGAEGPPTKKLSAKKHAKAEALAASLIVAD